MSSLHYFTHVVDGLIYGAWYRVTTANTVEVMGVGMLEVASFGGFSPENTAKSVLENSVRQRFRVGMPVPSLKELTDKDPSNNVMNLETSLGESRSPG
jgi:hypothetical protein